MAHVDATTTRLRRERVPNPTLFVDVAEQQPGQLYVGGGLALPLPLWRRNQGELARRAPSGAASRTKIACSCARSSSRWPTALRTLETRQAEAKLW